MVVEEAGGNVGREWNDALEVKPPSHFPAVIANCTKQAYDDQEQHNLEVVRGVLKSSNKNENITDIPNTEKNRDKTNSYVRNG